MPRRYDQMTDEEAREELERRHHPGEHRRRHGHSRMDPSGYERDAIFGAGYGWPLAPLPYPEAAYDPYTMQPEGWRRDRMGPYERDYDRYPRHQRDLMDRAGDEIASWFGDEEAAARREADHRGRGPKNYVRSDVRIEEDVNDRLTEDPFVDATEISVSVKEREITLDGTVDSRRAKRHAEDCAESVIGVTHVQNNLRVQPTD